MVVSSRGAIGGPRFSDVSRFGNATNGTKVECHENAEEASGIIFIVAGLSIAANCFIMFLIVSRKALRRWSHGLLFHQAMVDCARAAILMPLGTSILYCRPVNKCSLVETAFLLLVTVSTVNLLTTVLNDAPVLPDDDDDDAIPMLMDSPQCVVFGMFMIWFASITINLGPTFLSGALAANSESYLNKPSCPLIQGPFRHYVLNVLWIFINVLCVLLTMYHLYKLYKDLSRSNLEAVRVASLVTTMISVNQTPVEYDGHQRMMGTHGGGGGMSGLTGTTSINSEQNNPLLHQNNISRNTQGYRGPGMGPPTTSAAHDLALTHQTPLSESARIKSYIARLEREGIARVKMFIVITIAYLIFWGPLFLVTLFSYADYKTETPSTSHEVTLHVAFVHAFVNPTLFLVLHKGLRKATIDLLCCNFSRGSSSPTPVSSLRNNHQNGNRNHHSNDLMNNDYVPPPPLMNEGMGRGGILEQDGRPPRAYMMTETRSETGSKKETTL